MTCEHVMCALLSNWEFFAHFRCFLVFQVMMTVLLIDTTALNIAPMWTYGMSESASVPAISFLLFGSLVKIFLRVFFVIGLRVTWCVY